ncbi:MAG TPA: SdrD B-like domain-containing protein [Thermoanaerobaculia bacterium]|nr:SdrD B-like domain-containing protein [Thermoanaerobaculia bacterium]
MTFRGGSSEAEEALVAVSGSIATSAGGNPAVPQSLFGRREDVFLVGGPLATPCFFPAYLADGKYYFQVTDSTGGKLLSTDVVSERAVTVKGGVIFSYDGKTHGTGGKTPCGSLAVNLMPYADAGSRKAGYVAWLTPAANFDGSTSAVDSVCGAGCFHGFHADLSLVAGFRVEDKESCEPTFCFTGTKFNDANGNGARDPGENGLSGVTIRAAGDNGMLFSSLSGADGSFQICGVPDGANFRVFEVVPFGFRETGPPDRDISRRVFSRGGSYIVELCEADQSGLDFGNQAIPNAIGGLKFEDLNANGARDPGEPGLPGVTIVLTVAGGTATRTAVTDASGNFLFTDVAPGSYVLTEVVPSGFSQTKPASGGIPVTLASGGSSLDNVFGNFHGILTGTASGLKFNDANGNGVQDPGETGQPGVTITLTGGGITRTATTGSDGTFSFTAVPFGTYTVSETPPAGFVQTAPPPPGTISVLVDFGHQAVTGLVFGNRAIPGSIAGTKFNDLNGNGARDPGEPGLSGVAIQLRSSSGTVLTATSDSSGNFSFLGLQPGTYTMSETVPSGFVQTAPASPGTFSISVAPAQNATGFLFGNQAQGQGPNASISGTKFNDVNGNGVRDPGEPGITGVTIQLRNAQGQVTTQTTTAAGDFSFAQLAAGTYTLSEVVPPGFKQTAPPAPGTVSVTLASGQNFTGVLFGNQAQGQGQTGSISGIKYLDIDANGVVNGLDRPLEGIVIVLKDSSGATLRTTSGPDGTFKFSNLPAGTYVLSEELPPNFFQTFPGTPTNPGTYTITLTPGQNATGYQFLNKC